MTTEIAAEIEKNEGPRGLVFKRSAARHVFKSLKQVGTESDPKRSAVSNAAFERLPLEFGQLRFDLDAVAQLDQFVQDQHGKPVINLRCDGFWTGMMPFSLLERTSARSVDGDR